LPDLRTLDLAFFGQAKAVSTIERLLESADGPMNRAGTMRPAFTDKSVDWESLTQNMAADEKAALLDQRENERLALLAWIQSGLNRQAFEADDFRWDAAGDRRPITPTYLAADQTSTDEAAADQANRRVRIRSIVTDRCVTCHGENGRHELARWIPLDSYENIERHCRPEVDAAANAEWPRIALLALLPLGIVSGSVFYFTATPLATRRCLTAVLCAALAMMVGCWALGRPGAIAIYLLLCAAGIAALAVTMQIVASLGELLAQKQL
jgi:hypothetical protein